MPKATFDLIAPEKRERVLGEAARLFAERGYNQTDMAELAARAGVAKGSLYNYFTSKEDLYIHVCRDGLERSRRAVYGDLDPEWDIYHQIEHIFKQGVAFARAHPAYVILYLNVSSPGMEGFADRLSREVEKFTSDHLKHIIRRGQDQGSVRPDLDVNLSAFNINTLYIMLLASLVSRHYQIRLREYLEIKGRLTKQTVDEHLRRTINLIKRHLRPWPGDFMKVGRMS
jgi:AcrR family transcriptional regulator